MNTLGAKTLLLKEVHRFMRVPVQTVVSPLVSTTLCDEQWRCYWHWSVLSSEWDLSVQRILWRSRLPVPSLRSRR